MRVVILHSQAATEPICLNKNFKLPSSRQRRISGVTIKRWSLKTH